MNFRDKPYVEITRTESSCRGFFIIRLDNIGLEPERDPTFSQRLLNQQTDFIATLSGLAARAEVELRYVGVPNPDAPHQGVVQVGFRICVHGDNEDAVIAESIQIYRELAPHTLSISRSYQWQPVMTAEDYRTFVCEEISWNIQELARRERWMNLETIGQVPKKRLGFTRSPAVATDAPEPDKAYICYPYVRSYDSLEGLFGELLHQPTRTILCVQMRSTALTNAEHEFLQLQLLECERHLQLPLSGSVNDVRTFFPSLRTQADQIAIHIRQFSAALRDDIFLMQVFVMSPQAVSGLLCESIGVAISEHTHTSDPLSDATTFGSRPEFAGGFEWLYPSSHADSRDLLNSATQMDFRSVGANLLPEELRIRRLVNVAQAGCAFRLPVPIDADFPGLATRRVVELQPPKALQKGGLFLGNSHFRGTQTPIRLGPLDRLRHTYVIGKTGTGKSTFLKNCIVQDILDGNGLAVFDPHGELIDEVMPLIPTHRIDDVMLIKPEIAERSVGINLMDVETDLEKDSVVNYLLEVMNVMFNMDQAGGPMFEMYFRNAMLLLMYSPDEKKPVINDLLNVFEDSRFRDRKLKKCTDPSVVSFWRNQAEKGSGEHGLNNFAMYITSKLVRLTHSHVGRRIYSQRESTIDFTDVIENKRILLVDLSKGTLGESSAHFLGMTLIKCLQTAAYRRSMKTGDHSKKPFYMYIDEFQNLATPTFESLLSESRKYGIGIVAANQYVKQIPEEIRHAIFGNIGTLISFRVGVEDAEELEKSFAPHVLGRDFTTLPNFHAYVSMLSSGDICNPVSIYVEKKEHQVVPDAVSGIIEKMRGYSTETPQILASRHDESDLEDLSLENAIRKDPSLVQQILGMGTASQDE